MATPQAPLGNLSSLAEGGFTILRHPAFKKYQVRIKKGNFCDPAVNSYTGYIDIEARHLFFYFFESRSNPAKDDVIFWTNGGPGCSSSLGLFMELGPCRVLDEDGPKQHFESWNTNANIFFIDQPVGVGFSYAEHGEFVSTTEEAAKDIAAFVSIFFNTFEEYKGRAFHMAGESYGGRYIPLFASAVYDNNAILKAQGLEPINLKSIMIGNGMTDPFKMALAYYDMQCRPSIAPTAALPIGDCMAAKSVLKRCEEWMKRDCQDAYDKVNCGASAGFCMEAIEGPFMASGLNPYDMSKPCDGSVATTLCYPITRHITNYLSLPEVRSKLGVDPSVTGNFTSCSNKVGSAFGQAQDLLHPSTDYVAALLERGVRVLIYVGAYDWICNYIGNERWTLDLQWTRGAEFAAQPLRDWEVDGKVAGKTRSVKDFAFVTIDGAGHMVPYDKPKESLVMLQRWLAGEDF
ncbi:serine carboxypeptidase [Panaeolus papilionaceus]|nr:serine carboxypeptidase [Panaeolus papilionaceus]